MVYKFFNKKASGGAIKNKIISNKKLAEELHKPIVRKISSFIDHVWGADLADMQLVSKFKEGIRFLFVFLMCYWYLQEICLGCSFEEEKKGVTITNTFQKILVANQTKYG